MAQVEFTDTILISGLAQGLNTYTTFPSLQFNLNGGETGSYIIKGMIVYSSGGIAAGPPYSVQISTIMPNIGARPMYTTNLGTGVPNANITIFDPFQSTIVTSPTLGFNVNMTAAGTFYVVVSYSFFSSTVSLSSAFTNKTASVYGTTTGALITGTYANQATVINTVYLGNYTSSPIDFYLAINGFTISNIKTISPGNSFIYPIPLYLNSSQTLSVTTQGSGGVDCLVSIIQDPIS